MYQSLLQEQTDRGLIWLLRQTIEELRERNISPSSNNPSSDYATKLIAAAYGYILVNNRNHNFRAFDSSGNRFELRTKLLDSKCDNRILSAFKDLESKPFDELIVIFFDASFDIDSAYRIPHESVLKYAKLRAHTKLHILNADEAFLSEVNPQDITDELKEFIS